MNDEPKRAEMKELRLHRKRTQEVEGIQGDGGNRGPPISPSASGTEKLRALRLAKEAADHPNLPEPKAMAELPKPKPPPRPRRKADPT